jgi:hypothetical protein
MKYYFGRKNNRLNYRLYKRIPDFENSYIWYKYDPKNDRWNTCHQIPKDMKPIRKKNANEYLFLFKL